MTGIEEIMGRKIFNGDKEPLALFDRETGTLGKPKPKITAEGVMGRKPYAQRDFASTSGQRPSRDAGARMVIDMMDGLTNEEAQLVMTENAKGRVREGVLSDPTRHLGMYEKQAYRKGQQVADLFESDVGTMTPQQVIEMGSPGAVERKGSGNMTVDDALALGITRQKYGGDYGTKTIEETVLDKSMVKHGPFGRRYPDETRTRTRIVPRTAEEWLEADFNGPQREKLAGKDSEMMAMVAQALKAGTIVPRVDKKGNVTGYERRKEQEPWKPTAVDTDGDGMNDGVMTSPNSYQRFRTESPEDSPLYAWREGMPSRIMLDKNTLGVIDPVKKYYRPYAIENKKVYGVDPATGKRGEYMAANYDTEGLDLYNKWKPEGEVAAAAELSVKDQEALEWAQANPNDPQAERILKKLGVQ